MAVPDKAHNDYQIENQEWQASLNWVLENEPEARVKEILDLLMHTAAENGVKIAGESLITDYVNTIPKEKEIEYPGDLAVEEKILSAIRWNAMAMVVKANKKISGIGGHISTFSSAAHLFEVGFNHFFRGYEAGNPDLVYFQGHASPGLYARSFVEHRFDEKSLDHFRQEAHFNNGLSSYPHPRLMPDYWNYPTVSMGLSPIQAIYQARFIKYLNNRGIAQNADQRVWAFLGDGEMDEPESTGALSVASREKLNNLIFVINCNLQRLDGPVRGNRKVVNELEGIFKGAGWNVIKVLWSKAWDALFEKDHGRDLINILNQTVDGQFQNFAQADGKTRRESFFNQSEALKALVKDLSDEDLGKLKRGGHDMEKIFNAYHAALEYHDGPTVILAQTVKGYEQGDAGEASNVTHQKKKFSTDQLKAFRDVLDIPVSDKDLEKGIPYYRFGKNSKAFNFLSERRQKLGGYLPQRKQIAKDFHLPESKDFSEFHKGSGDRAVTTTAALVKILTNLLTDKKIKNAIVPIIPDEARTFGMDSLYGKVGIFAPDGQKYEPVDKGNLLFYNEEKQGAILEEGITEAGSMASFIAAGTSHVCRPQYAIPFFAFYSMFGFQRIGDLIWAAADSRARGFLIGGISGKSSLSGEGLQHTDGYSHVNALAVPDLRAYDPAFAYELAVIVEDGIKRMYQKNEDHFYYITVSNQGYPMPEMPKGVKEGILNGIYRFRKSSLSKNKEQKTNLFGSGAIMKEVIEAGETLEKEHNIPTDIWSVTSYKQLYDRANANDSANGKGNHFPKLMNNEGELVVAATDYIKALPLSVANQYAGTFIALGTDGFGQSDTTPVLRKHFKIDAKHIVHTVLEFWDKKRPAGNRHARTNNNKKAKTNKS